MEIQADYRAAVDGMRAILERHVPHNGPPKRMPLTRPLKGKYEGLFEFRKQPRGQKLRVVWFYDENRVVVCTVAFSKAESTPPQQLRRSDDLRGQYFAAKAARDVVVIDP